MEDLKRYIREVADYPKPGINFYDITTLLKEPQGLRATVDSFGRLFRGRVIDKVVGIESRGFLFGPQLAYSFSAGFVPVRKPGKLPHRTIGEDYQLEYGTDRLEIHEDAIAAGDLVLLVDDLIATGGTAEAALKLIEKAGGKLAGACFVVDLPDLGGSDKLRARGADVMTLCSFEGE